MLRSDIILRIVIFGFAEFRANKIILSQRENITLRKSAEYNSKLIPDHSGIFLRLLHIILLESVFSQPNELSKNPLFMRFLAFRNRQLTNNRNLRLLDYAKHRR